MRSGAGFFDGIHLGHAALLDRTRQRAQALGLTPAALSFDTHPDTLVFGTAVPLLNTMAERELLMRRLCGMEQVIFAHFDEAMMHMPWQVFVEDYLVRQLHAKHVVCGHDFHFGDRGQGDPARLQEKCRELGIGCDVIPEIRVDGSAVSSTRIRRLLQTGRCEEAVRLLGHGQLVTGRVTRGAGRAQVSASRRPMCRSRRACWSRPSASTARRRRWTACAIPPASTSASIRRSARFRRR
ncbi:MAG: hypothetical protein ACLT1T_06880 [Oscillospiraceae bacterium]